MRICEDAIRLYVEATHIIFKDRMDTISDMEMAVWLARRYNNVTWKHVEEIIEGVRHKHREVVYR